MMLPLPRIVCVGIGAVVLVIIAAHAEPPGVPDTRVDEVIAEWRAFVARPAEALDRAEAVRRSSAAPPLTIVWSSDPDIRSLEALRGRVVLLDFFTTWCGPCRAALPHLRALRERYDESDFTIIGVTSPQGVHYTGDGETIDTEGDPHREFELMSALRDELDIPWPVVFTEQPAANPDYAVVGIPSLTIIDRTGRVHAAGLHPWVSALRIDEALRALLGDE